MNEKKRFVGIFLLTITITRLLIYFVPRNSFIYADNLHHIFYGIILLGVYFFIKRKSWSYVLLAIALGLIVDEITQFPFYISHLLGYSLASISFWDYWSSYSVLSTAVATAFVTYLIWRNMGFRKA